MSGDGARSCAARGGGRSAHRGKLGAPGRFDRHQLIARKWDYSERRKQPGRPRVMVEISELVVGMAKSNPKWGYTRIRGALSNLGHTVARNPTAPYLAELSR